MSDRDEGENEETYGDEDERTFGKNSVIDLNHNNGVSRALRVMQRRRNW